MLVRHAVVDAHPLSANAAYDAALQKRWALACRPPEQRRPIRHPFTLANTNDNPFATEPYFQGGAIKYLSHDENAHAQAAIAAGAPSMAGGAG